MTLGPGPEHVGREGVKEIMDLADHPHQVLLDLLPEAFVVVDVATRRFVLANAAAERLTGYSQAELQALTPGDVWSWRTAPPGDGLRDAQPGTVSRREWMLRTKDGRVIPSASPRCRSS